MLQLAQTADKLFFFFRVVHEFAVFEPDICFKKKCRAICRPNSNLMSIKSQLTSTNYESSLHKWKPEVYETNLVPRPKQTSTNVIRSKNV